MARRVWIVITLLAAVLSSARPATAQLRATLFASGFTRPLGFIAHPTDASVVFILEKDGRIRTVTNGVVGADFLNLTTQINPSGEQGLLGMVFAPDFATSGRVFVSFNNGVGDSVIARFTPSISNPQQLDPATRFDLVWPDGSGGTRPSVDQPDTFSNHKGGNIAFGPDGMLYIGLGDGGSGSDPFHYAQNPNKLLGKMLRIDVNVPNNDLRGYRIPPDNPFVGISGWLPEIWALGLRNPWRWSFDYPGPQSTGALVIADVGQGSWEEVDYEPAQVKGRNYGWRNKEGTFDLPGVPYLPPATTPLKDPILQYPHPVGASITGGFVYRGSALGPFYVGRYFFADFVTAKIWSLGMSVDLASGDAWGNSFIDHSNEFSGVSSQVASFGVDLAGELYLVRHSGSVYKIGLAGAAPAAGCSNPDPWAGLGGGRCYSGTWYAPVIRGDLTNDGLADLLLQDGAPFGGGTPSNALTLWQMQFASQRASTPLTILPSPTDPLNTAGWRAIGVDDFTGDGRADILVQNTTTGAVRVRVMHGTRQIATESVFEGSNAWTVVATGDFNLDGSPDLIWQHLPTGTLYAWLLRPSRGKPTLIGQGYVLNESAAPLLVGDLAWRVVGAGDFSGDGRLDLVLQNESTGAVQIYYINWLQRTATVPTVPGAAGLIWKIRAVADYNGDRRADLVWQQAKSGSALIYIWYMNGPNLFAEGFASPNASVDSGINGGR